MIGEVKAVKAVKALEDGVASFTINDMVQNSLSLGSQIISCS